METDSPFESLKEAFHLSLRYLQRDIFPVTLVFEWAAVDSTCIPVLLTSKATGVAPVPLWGMIRSPAQACYFVMCTEGGLHLPLEHLLGVTAGGRDGLDGFLV